MKAIIWTKYGSPEGLQLREVATPTPKEQEVLIKIHAATVSTPDSELRRLKLPLLFSIPIRLYMGLLKPTRTPILGTEFAGEVVAIGKAVTQYAPGDQVYGYTGLAMGTYAEYICVAEKPTALASVMAKKASSLSYEEAAAVSFGGLEAFHALKQVQIQPGQRVLIVGAGGSIGTYAVQLAKYQKAEVTGVDKPGKLEMLRAIGADHVIDYTREDFTKNGKTYDVILDTIGASRFSRSLKSLREHGTYINAQPGLLGRMHMSRKPNRTKRILPWTAG
ncbi:MAG TPA: NAD(P)-dependent alcohol dehydrogenase, partial [Anaerolineales bacterium]|nr:NAD(P)-dependent alcohol dehydrogenase [Anaerolineales bacterium]